MVNNVLGMLVGAAIDREDGDSGVEGALTGYLVEGAIKVLAPVVVTFAIGAAVQFLARRAIESVTGDSVSARGD
jgi:hypothetical protein